MELGPDELARRMVIWHGLGADRSEAADQTPAAVLQALRMIQLDPLDPIGTNADLVLAARSTGTRKGQVYTGLLPGHAFEHFAKERCLLPAEVFPMWREQALQAPWWRLTERLKRVDEGLIAEVLDEVRARGPVTAAELADRGRVKPMDWSGWRGTAKAATLALEVLWTRCRIVVCGRRGRQKVYDVPERALPEVHDSALPPDPDRVRLLDRVRAAGMLPTVVGPWWSGLRTVRDTRVQELIEAGELVKLQVPGSRRTWLALPAFLEQSLPAPDERMRVLGPLDPLLWDRKLVEALWDFRYVWEVYKPAAKREWGWYVCPLLHRGRLVGRLEARVIDGRLVVQNTWDEGVLEPDALARALGRHADFLGVAPP